MKTKLKSQNGFTIIEVLIVLAIAGLIMLIVFLAVPALQRNQRNNARNSDASRITAQGNTCLSNRNNQVGSCFTPATLDVGNLSQLTGTIGFGYNGFGATLTSATFNTDNAYVLYNAECNSAGSGVQANTGPGTRFTVTYQLENGINRCLQG